MDFYEVVGQVLALLQRQGSASTAGQEGRSLPGREFLALRSLEEPRWQVVSCRHLWTSCRGRRCA